MRTYETWETADQDAIEALFGRRLDTAGFLTKALEVAYRFEAVLDRGDEAIRDLATSTVAPESSFWLELDEETVGGASDTVVMREVRNHIRDFYLKQKTPSWFDSLPWGAMVGQLESGPGRVGVVLPRNDPFNASLALLYGIPAQLAGAEEIILNVPPPCPPRVASLLGLVAGMLGRVRLLSLPEDLALFAMAAGTGSIPRVDRIIGRGSAEGQAAALAISPHQVVHLARHPSRVMVLTDASVDARALALDLLTRIERSPHQLLAVVSPSILVANELTDQVTRLRREDRENADPLIRELDEVGGVIMTRTLQEAVDLVNRTTPEEVVVLTEDPLGLLPRLGGGASVRLGRCGPPPLDWLDPTIDGARATGSIGFAGSPPTLATFTRRAPFVHRIRPPEPAHRALARELCEEAGLVMALKALDADPPAEDGS